MFQLQYKRLLSFTFLSLLYFSTALYASEYNFIKTTQMNFKKNLETQNDFFQEPSMELLSEEIFLEEQEVYILSDYLQVKESFLSRTFSNKDKYPSNPYIFVLGEAKYTKDNYELDFGFAIYNYDNKGGVELNQASYSYVGDSFEFKIGKYVKTIGVLDYMSMINLSNPSRPQFFDDENINIRRIPLLMSEITYYPNESFKLQATLQPFDNKHQDYTSTYLNFIIDAYLPNYFKSLSSKNTSATAIHDEIFLPAYNDGISPALNSYVKGQYDHGSTSDVSKAGGILVAEYLGEEASYGAVWINRYSEIPLVEINTQVLDALGNLDSATDVSQGLEDYVNSGNSDLVSKVAGYRYNQYNLYYEGTADAFGIRVESSLRDKIPTVNKFTWVSSLGMGVDYSGEDFYNNLELQWLHLDSLNENVYAGMLTTKMSAIDFGEIQLLFDHYLLFGYYNSLLEISTFPNITFVYKDVSIILQYLASKEQSELNSASLIVKAVF